MIEFIVEGKQVPKERPRAGKNGVFYTPSRTMEYEHRIVDTYLNLHHSKRQKYEKNIPLVIETYFYIEFPKSFSKAKREKALKKELFPKRKDIDNLLKSVLDALNKIAYEDDSQIIEARVSKIYAERSFTKIKIFDLHEDIYQEERR